MGVASSSSASYIITTDILDSGGINSSSTSIKLTGKARGLELSLQSSVNFIIGAGFLRSAYFSKKIIFAPIVTSISPNSALNTGPVDITNLAGANFQTGATVKVSRSGHTDIFATNVSVSSSNKITCTFDLTGKSSGAWTVIVTNPDGQSGSLASAFTISIAAPTISSITPSSGLNNASILNITNLSGSNFRAGAAVKLSMVGQSDIIAGNTVVESASKITCQFNLLGKTVGLWDVVITNDDGQSATLLSGFKIESPSIEIIGPVVSTANPFNPSSGPTKIKYTLSKDTDIIIYVYNMRGERVWQWVSPAGNNGGKTGVNEVVWDGLTSFNSVASFGVYIVEITAKSDGSYRSLGRTKIAVTK